MSAPPPKNTNGPPKRKPNPLRPMRPRPKPRPIPSDAVKRPGQKPSPGPAAAGSSGPTITNGSKQSLEELRKMYGGWSEPPPSYPYTDIPIMTTKKALLEGIRYHLMRLSSTKADGRPIDPTDQEEFARPVTLHRRDARLPPPGRVVKEEALQRPPVDEQEKERLAQIKAEKEAQRAINQAKIAPVAKEVVPKKPKKQKEERTVFNRGPRTAAAKKESDLRYEEALPWHLEDVDGKNVWVGSYVAALSESSVAFVIDQSVFRMVPLEKWYRFTAKPHFQAFTIDQAEEYMNRKIDVGRWVMKDEEKKNGQQDLEATRRMLYGSGMIKTESDTFKAASRAEKMEHDEIDMSGDEFQDDDEAPMFERNDDEDTKDSKERIRREQLGANLFGDGDEGRVDQELRQQLKEELERQKFGKATRKALIKRDREDIYESDNSEDNPWSSSSDEDSSDEENEEKKEDDKKESENKDDKDDKGKGKASGAQGSTTPQEKQKHGDKKSKSLKRAGSPALSESSGNESSRKKMKKSVVTAPGSRAGTPIPGAARKKKLGAGSTSDGEATAGEMSDGATGPRKKIKLVGSAKGTPSASRAGSPAARGPSPPPSSSGIEQWEILEKIPDSGISIVDLIKPFQSRVGTKPGQIPKSEWIKLVTRLCEYGPDKLLRKRK
ncbi:Transcription Factor IIF, Rap30/Rap74, interaction [Cordyceps fumosorosea ARSEF 2679]|uniref:Transcription initiation factor IIF subunit alpha n=1 Tax=Cordyceps fumosorosea (strain ARSEF 2679) TaxID=1081104 RepID=A0A167NVL2_CORFA|nr:Transcription Factor IIF, Rap30/Rap74, interaction [Cordyceps fumosorosea ARSEF 2679]OAA55993.1 Transcription Factor IIF, Rap30/Rap74, interaction [Cordyceps fumosorosea ARSEF 2679]